MNQRVRKAVGRIFKMVVGLACLFVLVPGPGQAKQSWPGRIPNGDALENECDVCHTDTPPNLNFFGGDAFLTLSNSTIDWAAFALWDSDGDGQSNGLELGDPCGTWADDGVLYRDEDISNPADPESMTEDLSSPECAAVPTPPPPIVDLMDCPGYSVAATDKPPIKILVLLSLLAGLALRRASGSEA